MKILVCIKQVPHQDARLDVNAAGTWIQEDNIKFEINPYDQNALEAALQLKDKDASNEVVVVSIGPERVTQSLRTALGMGADRAVHVKDAAADGSDSLGTAKILAAVAKAENPDLVFAGFMSDDGNLAATGPMLATLLGIPHTTTAVHFEKNGGVKVERELEGGALEVVELSTPCLVTTQTGMNQVRYASLKGIMAAKKKPIDVKTVADLGLAGQVGAGAAKIKIEKLYTPPKGQGAEMLTGSVDDVVGKVVGKIKELGLL
jgi:electron transfer flavoprotein beta subunit